MVLPLHQLVANLSDFNTRRRNIDCKKRATSTMAFRKETNESGHTSHFGLFKIDDGERGSSLGKSTGRKETTRMFSIICFIMASIAKKPTWVAIVTNYDCQSDNDKTNKLFWMLQQLQKGTHCSAFSNTNCFPVFLWQCLCVTLLYCSNWSFYPYWFTVKQLYWFFVFQTKKQKLQVSLTHRALTSR